MLSAESKCGGIRRQTNTEDAACRHGAEAPAESNRPAVRRTACRFPATRAVHTVRGKAWHRINFINEHRAIFFAQEKVDPRQTGTVNGKERANGQLANLVRRLPRNFGRNNHRRFAVDILGFIIIKFVRGYDLSYDGSLRFVIAEHRHLNFTGVDELLYDDFTVVKERQVDRFNQLFARTRLLIPTLDPRLAGFTKQGYPMDTSISMRKKALSFSHCVLVK